MRTWLIRCVTAAILAAVSLAPARAAIFTFSFDGTSDSTVTAPLVGSGTFSFDGPATVGTVALTSVANYAFSFTFGSTTFTNSHLMTPIANILVQIATSGSDLVVTFGGSMGGPFGGSIDFINSESSLSFQPGFGTLYFSNGNYGTYLGVTEPAAVPEPMILGLFGLGLAGLVAARRWRA